MSACNRCHSPVQWHDQPESAFRVALERDSDDDGTWRVLTTPAGATYAIRLEGEHLLRAVVDQVRLFRRHPPECLRPRNPMPDNVRQLRDVLTRPRPTRARRAR